MTIEHWLLPDGVEDILPDTAARLEQARRVCLDLFKLWGYQYVIPPKLEFLESLLTGTGQDLDLKTFKVIDQLTGRMMGLPADLTPQTARIDAHSLGHSAVTRLCYADFVLQSRPDHMLASRTPLKVGAELFGEPELSGDIEMISLLMETLDALGLESVQLELGDVSIFRCLLDQANLDQAQQAEIFSLVQRKSHDALAKMVRAQQLPEQLAQLICELPRFSGDVTILDKAGALVGHWPQIARAIDNLAELSGAIKQRFPNVQLSFDLSELRGFEYHTGVVFSVFLPESGQTVAKGGRYDNIGAVFGRARAATGFDIELLSVSDHLAEMPVAKVVHCDSDSSMDTEQKWSAIAALRSEGYIVIEGSAEQKLGDARLAWVHDAWELQPIEQDS
jgi:ATP phosphoribosyltransferase regulatory subunit